MTSKELRRLSRRDLLELLLRQQQENDALTAELADLKKQLQDRSIQIRKTGSLAEAALALNGVFADADKAVEQYMENIQRYSEKLEKDYDIIAQAAKRRAAEIISAAEEEKRKRMEEVDFYYYQKIDELKELIRTHPELKELLARSRSEK